MIESLIHSESRIDIDFLSFLMEQKTDPFTHVQALAQIISQVDKKYDPYANYEKIAENFVSLILNNYFLPSIPILIQGTEPQQTLFQDTVMKLSDDFDDILNILKQTTILVQNDVQVGLDFSELRATRSSISSSPKQCVGPIRFMELFAQAPQSPDKKTAMRFFLNINHLDIEEYLSFILTAPSHVRFALGIHNEFIHALKNKSTIGLKHKYDAEPSQEISAHCLFKSIAKIILKEKNIDFFFMDQMDRFKKTHAIPSTTIMNTQNQLVYPHELMSTGTINVSQFDIENPNERTKYSQIVSEAIHFLDNCFEINFYANENTKSATKKFKRIGLTPIGIHAFLENNNPEHDEQRSLTLLVRLIDFLNQKSILTSKELRARRGGNNQIYFKDQWHKTRHAQLLSQIHTPLLSQLANTPQGLFRREMTLKNFYTLYPQHLIWQDHLFNIASIKHPMKSVDIETIMKLFLYVFDAGLFTFET